MKTKKCLLTLLILPFFYSCVTDKSYVPINVTKEFLYKPIVSNNINFNFRVYSGNNRMISIYFWFDENIKQQKIKEITFELISKDNSYFSLENVSVSGYVDKNKGFLNTKKNKNFKEVPYEFRLTKKEKEKIYYSFDYISNKKIIPKYLKALYYIELEDGSVLTYVFDLKLNKSSRFAVH